MTGNPLDDFTRQAVSVFGHLGSAGYYERLSADGTPTATRCRSCQRVAFPPRAHCPSCFGTDVEWVPLPTEGSLYAFTTNKRGLRFAAPSVVGVVEIPEVGLVLGPIAGQLSDLRIGQPVRLEVIDVCDGLRFHHFVPADPSGEGEEAPCS